MLTNPEQEGRALTPQHDTMTVIGGGLAGCEAAWQLAERDIPVRLFEMRPARRSPAHHTDLLGELVCSNSLKSNDPNTAAGRLKRELEAMGSIVLQCATRTRVAAGGALAVDRTLFASMLTRSISEHPLITVERSEVATIEPGRTIVATGPLTSPAMESALQHLLGADRLAFFDAAAPIVEEASLDRGVVFAASRYDKGDGPDYLNAPMTREEYDLFLDALIDARRVIDKVFDRKELFAACQPVEEVARTGRDALRFGALKPVGLVDPRTGERPWAVVQLRAENAAGSAYNLVGFQTNLAWPEQKRVFSLIPGLGEAEFLRYGVMHRNTFLDTPRLLDATLALKSDSRIRFAGQITGTEGYAEAAASGLLAALNSYADIAGGRPVVLPSTTALGSLIAYATSPQTSDYQPMHVNWGVVPPLTSRVKGKRDRYAAYSLRAANDFDEWMATRTDLFPARGHVALD